MKSPTTRVRVVFSNGNTSMGSYRIPNAGSSVNQDDLRAWGKETIDDIDSSVLLPESAYVFPVSALPKDTDSKKGGLRFQLVYVEEKKPDNSVSKVLGLVVYCVNESGDYYPTKSPILSGHLIPFPDLSLERTKLNDLHLGFIKGVDIAISHCDPGSLKNASSSYCSPGDWLGNFDLKKVIESFPDKSADGSSLDNKVIHSTFSYDFLGKSGLLKAEKIAVIPIVLELGAFGGGVDESTKKVAGPSGDYVSFVLAPIDDQQQLKTSIDQSSGKSYLITAGVTYPRPWETGVGQMGLDTAGIIPAYKDYTV